MPDQSYLALSGALLEAQEAQASLANSVLHLFKSDFTPQPTSTLSDFLTAECDFDGYEPLTITAWEDPVLAGVGWAIYAPTQTFRWSHDTDDVGNIVGGHFLVTAGGVLKDYTSYDPQLAMTGPGMAIIKTPVEVFPAG
jgi:hypothetical protein